MEQGDFNGLTLFEVVLAVLVALALASVALVGMGA